MKYPQLVSTRAVNAISDWLVSRLEQLGVEAPQIYTRLLLSLLQSSVQINDPIEFSNLETFFANRKGSNRRYLPCDTDTLKKLNAVQCLREIVSSEQEIATIENLVDELCEKLKDIEKQTTDIEDEDQQLVATLSVATTATVGSSAEHNTAAHYSLQQQHHHIYSNNNNNKHHNNNSNGGGREEQQPLIHSNERRGGEGVTAVDSETDPKKRYFRAFPALSKEMEESFRVWRRNAKSLTWPVVDRNNISSISAASSTSSSSSTLSNSFGSSSAVVGGGGSAKASEECGAPKSGTSNKVAGDIIAAAGGIGLGNLNNSETTATGTSIAAAGVKRKSKRRRNQALSKGKTIQNIRKNSTGNTVGCTSGGGGGNNLTAFGGGGRHYRNASPTFWDTDFEGSWEMGRDLIKEFIVKQNKSSNRNRSTSESAAYGMRAAAAAVTAAAAASAKVETKKRAAAAALSLEAPPTPHSKMNIAPEYKQREEKHPYEKVANTAEPQSNVVEPEQEESKTVTASSKTSSPLLPVVDISFCCGDDDDGYGDASNTTAAAMVAPPRRLYQRDALNFGSREEMNATALDTAAETSTASSDEQFDFEQFKAKFNSSVEALWKDVDPPAQPSVDAFALHSSSLQMPAATVTSTFPAVAAPFKEDLRNFWSNYYSHHFDLAKIPQQLQQSVAVSTMDESGGGASLSCSGGSTSVATASANASDYFSMPIHLDDFDKSVGAVRRDFGCSDGGSGDGEHNTPIGVFLQNSIWSQSSNATAADTDESFYLKVWNSTKKFNQLDAAHGSKIIAAGGGLKLHDTALNFPTLNVSKWSEGINAGPPQQQQPQPPVPPPPQQQQQLRLPIGTGSAAVRSNNNNNNTTCHLLNTCGVDCTDSSNNTTATASVSSTSCSSSYTHSSAAAAYSWQTPVIGQNLQADLQSWSASNPVSLTEMYGGGTSATDGGKLSSLGGGVTTIEPPTPAPTSIIGPSVTLPNHSPTRSGFIAYARIKAVRVLQHDATPIRVKDSHYAAPVAASIEDDEDGENLLTSERTHFHPIKTYADGHTFDICSALDIIDYARRPTAAASDCDDSDFSDEDDGYLYLDGQRYLPYTRSDNFTTAGYVGEDGGEPAATSATPLYAASNCDANARKSKNNNGNYEEFVLKFRLRGREIATQTDADAHDLLLAADKLTSQRCVEQLPHHPLYTIFSNASGMQLPPPTRLAAAVGTGRACSDAIVALNKAVAAAAEAAAAAHLPHQSHWLPSSTTFLGGCDLKAAVAGAYHYQQPASQSLISSGATIWSTRPPPALLLDATAVSNSCDEVDFCIDAEQQQWSMREIRKKCQLKGHHHSGGGGSSSHVFNNNNEDGGTDSDAASLWGMCTACNSEFKSVPANRLLRDELQLEADEIMSDLKYMQDLYIGGGAGGDIAADAVSELSDWEADEEEDEEEEPTEKGAEELQALQLRNGGASFCAATTTAEPMDDDKEEEEEDEAAVKEDKIGGITQASTVLQKVNQLIANLLRPELTSAAVEPGIANVMPLPPPQQQFSGSLWLVDNNARNIWQQHSEVAATQTIAAVGDDGAESAAAKDAAAAPPTLPPLNWAHDNLAQIWQQNTPPPPPSASASACHSTDSVSSSSISLRTKIADKNYKNLQASFDAAIAAAAFSDAAEESADAPHVSSSTLTFGEKPQEQQPQKTEEEEEMLPAFGESYLPPQFNKNNSSNETAAFKRVQQFLASNAAATSAGVASAKLKLANRKRRHSASQNFFQLPLSVGNSSSSSNNNNSVDMADLNRFNWKFFSPNAASVGTSAFSDDIDMQKFLNSSLRHALLAKKSSNAVSDAIPAYEGNFYEGSDSAPPQQNANVAIAEDNDHNDKGDIGDDDNLNAPQTYITCNYWTATLEPIATEVADAATVGETIVGESVIVGGADGSATFCLIDKNSASILKHVTMVTRPLTR